MVKKKNKKTFTLATIILIIFFLATKSVHATELNLNSDKYILYNLDENTILDKKDENKEASVASLTKIMTTIVAIENIKDFDKTVIITKEMFKDIAWDVSVAGFKVNDEVTYNDLLYGAILPSGADAVNALALSVSDSYEEFVKLMNKKVNELKLKHTHFSNVTGLYSEENYSSAYDMAQILKYALKNKKFKKIFETKKYTFTTGKTVKSTIEHYNSRIGLKDISYITGGKTGYINASGYCLATTAKIDNVNYLLITLNADNTKTAPHIEDAITTYEYYSKNYGNKIIVDKNDEVVTLKAKSSREKQINIKANTIIEKYLKKDFDKNKIKYNYDGVKKVSYFTKKGTKLGTVEVVYNDIVLDKFDLIYSQALTFSLCSFIWNNLLLIIFLFFVLFILFRIVQLSYKKRKRRKNRRRQMKYHN